MVWPLQSMSSLVASLRGESHRHWGWVISLYMDHEPSVCRWTKRVKTTPVAVYFSDFQRHAAQNPFFSNVSASDTTATLHWVSSCSAFRASALTAYFSISAIVPWIRRRSTATRHSFDRHKTDDLQCRWTHRCNVLNCLLSSSSSTVHAQGLWPKCRLEWFHAYIYVFSGSGYTTRSLRKTTRCVDLRGIKMVPDNRQFIWPYLIPHKSTRWVAAAVV